MTNHNIHHTGTPVQPYADPYQLGQRIVARFRLELAEEALAKALPEAYAEGYVPEEWRAMRLRQVAECRAEIERAKAVLQ